MSKPVVTAVTLLVLASAFLSPTAAAADCWEIKTSVAAQGLRIIANLGQQVAFGFATDEAGGGFGAVLVVNPAACGGVSIPGQSGVPDIRDALTGLLPSFPALP